MEPSFHKGDIRICQGLINARFNLRCNQGVGARHDDAIRNFPAFQRLFLFLNEANGAACLVRVQCTCLQRNKNQISLGDGSRDKSVSSAL